MVFIGVMKTKIQHGRRENGLHPSDEDQNPAREMGKMVFIRVMKTRIQHGRRENGLHRGDEDQNPAWEKGEWSSSE